MSCFIAPLVQAVAVSACRKHLENRNSGNAASVWAAQLPTLEKMLWGASIVLVFDHLVHGELFAFDLKELLCVGLPMCLIVTAVWTVVVLRKIHASVATKSVE